MKVRAAFLTAVFYAAMAAAGVYIARFWWLIVSRMQEHFAQKPHLEGTHSWILATIFGVALAAVSGLVVASIVQSIGPVFERTKTALEKYEAARRERRRRKRALKNAPPLPGGYNCRCTTNLVEPPTSIEIKGVVPGIMSRNPKSFDFGVTCPDCKGDGRQCIRQERETRQPENRIYETHVYLVCPTCEGRGRVSSGDEEEADE
jgi:hypothetical protein